MATKKQSKSDSTALRSGRLEILITIVNRNKAEYYLDLIQSIGANMQFSAQAQGTASSEVLKNFLDFASSEKTVIFSVIREEDSRRALDTLAEKFQTIKGGKGIAYTVSMSSVIGVSIYGFLSNNRMAVKEEEKA